MLNIKILMILLCTLLFSACGTPGPMQQVNGPFHTNSFDTLVLSHIKDDSKEILYKKETRMFKNGNFVRKGIFVLTKKAVYLVNWNKKKLEYIVSFKLSMNEVLYPRAKSMSNNRFNKIKVLMIADYEANQHSLKISNANKVVKIIDDLLDK
ncbi:MAG: hypothetical protein HRT40_07485 [Campylobacteraceae bacterium]|nr:hypothetical protein [Campylobacteraceae bacterium]